MYSALATVISGGHRSPPSLDRTALAIRSSDEENLDSQNPRNPFKSWKCRRDAESERALYKHPRGRVTGNSPRRARAKRSLTHPLRLICLSTYPVSSRRSQQVTHACGMRQLRLLPPFLPFFPLSLLFLSLPPFFTPSLFAQGCTGISYEENTSTT